MLDSVPENRETKMLADGCIIKKADSFYASIDGVHGAKIPEYIAKNIASLLSLQNKADSARKVLNRPGYLKQYENVLHLLNCRKTAFGVTEAKPFKELLKHKRSTPEGEEILTGMELSGIPELLQDLKRLSGMGRVPVLGTGHNLEIFRYLEDHEADLPAIVHVFEINSSAESDVISALLQNPKELSEMKHLKKMVFDHTFLAFGKDDMGNQITFHREGPEKSHRFRVTDLGAVEVFTVGLNPNRMYLSFIGPAPTPGQPKNVKTSVPRRASGDSAGGETSPL